MSNNNFYYPGLSKVNCNRAPLHVCWVLYDFFLRMVVLFCCWGSNEKSRRKSIKWRQLKLSERRFIIIWQNVSLKKCLSFFKNLALNTDFFSFILIAKKSQRLLLFSYKIYKASTFLQICTLKECGGAVERGWFTRALMLSLVRGLPLSSDILSAWNLFSFHGLDTTWPQDEREMLEELLILTTS